MGLFNFRVVKCDSTSDDSDKGSDPVICRIFAVADATVVIILSVGSSIALNTFIKEYAAHPDAMKESIITIAPIVSALIGVLVTKYKKQNNLPPS